MSLTTSEMSPADLRAVMGNNDDGFGFGGNGAWWIIILLLFGWGGRGYGFGGGFGGGQGGGYGYPCCGTPATQADLSAAFASNSVLSGINGIDSTLCQGFNGINTAILQNGYNTQAGINTLSNQIADCCCTTQRAIDSVNYNGAINTGNIIQAQERGTQKILDAICGNRMQDMQNQINQLQLQSALCGVVRYPNAITYNAGVSPFFGGCNPCCNPCNI